MTPFETLVELRKKYGTPLTPEENAALMNDTAYAHRSASWGVYKKTGGSNCKRSDGMLISRDILCQLGSSTGVDCLQDSDGEAIPTWNEGVEIDPNNWLMPITPAVGPTPDPDPVPVPTTMYGQFVLTEMPMLAAAFREKRHNEPSPSDYAHLAWRRLIEHWTLSDMIKDI